MAVENLFGQGDEIDAQETNKHSVTSVGTVQSAASGHSLGFEDEDLWSSLAGGPLLPKQKEGITQILIF